MNGRKGGHPFVYHLSTGYSFTSSAKIFSDGIPVSISKDQLSILKRAFEQNDLRLAFVKTIGFWSELDHDPDLSDEEEQAPTPRR